MFRSTCNTSFKIRYTKTTIPITDSVHSAKSIRAEVKNDLWLHSKLNALVDVQPHCGFLVVLKFSFLDRDGGVAMLLHALQRRSQGFISEGEFLIIVIYPVIRTRTKKRMLPLEMRMRFEAQ